MAIGSKYSLFSLGWSSFAFLLLFGVYILLGVLCWFFVQDGFTVRSDESGTHWEFEVVRANG